MQDRPNITTVPPPNAEVRTFTFEDQGGVPNNPDLPVLVMRGVITGDAAATAICDLLESNGWCGTWQWTVFDYHHYHPNAHEVLVVASGSAELALGGPSGEIVQVEIGDAIVLPAGTGHCRASASPDFKVCGAYPEGQENYETLRADDPRPSNLPERIARTPLPGSDPIYGSEGPVTELWQTSR